MGREGGGHILLWELERASWQPCVDGKLRPRGAETCWGSRVRLGALHVDLQTWSPYKMSGPGLSLGGNSEMGGSPVHKILPSTGT